MSPNRGVDLVARSIVRCRRSCTQSTGPGSGPAMQAFGQAFQNGPVVDVTAIHDDVVESGRSFNLYEDAVLRPPWEFATLSWADLPGKMSDAVVHMTFWNVPADADGGFADHLKWDPEKDSVGFAPPGHSIDWSNVAWITHVAYWADILNEPLGPAEPVHFERVAVGADGTALDHNFIQIRPNIPVDTWNDAKITWLRSISFLNLRNVELVTPDRSRPVRRRLERQGVTLSEIQVFGPGRSYPSKTKSSTPSGGLPLTSVRGHVARYGVDGRGLLFGKYSGEFWIPAHARGEGQPHEQRFVVDDEVSG